MPSFDDYVATLEQTGTHEERRLLDEARARFRLASQLIDIRSARGLSQRDLEQASGIAQSEISRIESGLANPTIKTLNLLGSSLGVELVLQDPTAPSGR